MKVLKINVFTSGIIVLLLGSLTKSLAQTENQGKNLGVDLSNETDLSLTASLTSSVGVDSPNIINTNFTRSNRSQVECPNGIELRSPINFRRGKQSKIGNTFGIKPRDPWDMEFFRANGRFPQEDDEEKRQTLEKIHEEGKTKHEFSGNIFYGIKRNNFFARIDGSNLWFQLGRTPESELTFKFSHWKTEYVFGMGRLIWGQNKMEGSEHTLNQKELPLELQLYHFRKSDGSIQKSRANNGLLIITRLFDLSDHWEGNKGLDTLIDAAQKLESGPNITLIGSFHKISGSLEFSNLLPWGTQSHIFQYFGTETTTPCANANWLVFQESGLVSLQQLTRLYNLQGISPKAPVYTGNDTLVTVFGNSENEFMAFTLQSSLETTGHSESYFRENPIITLIILSVSLIIFNFVLASVYNCLGRQKTPNTKTSDTSANRKRKLK